MRNSQNKRLWCNALPLVEHPSFGTCVLLSRESANNKWSLFGGGKNYWESSRSAIKRELQEEMGKQIQVLKRKDLWEIETRSAVRRIFAVLLDGEVKIDKKEIVWVGYYPLAPKHQEVRDKLWKNMDFYAKKAIEDNTQRLLQWWYKASNISVSEQDSVLFYRKVRKVILSRLVSILR